MNIHILETIAKYGLKGKEEAAARMAACYEYLSRKVFPEMRLGRPPTGDPRTTETFKYAWKAINEAEERGEPLERSDLKFYVLAQLKVFKSKIDQGGMPLLTPNCLAGETSWKRWKLFMNRFEKQKSYTSLDKAGVDLNVSEKVKEALQSDKAYLQKRFGRLSQEDILNSLNSNSLNRWVSMKLVSGYYPYLSPVVENWIQQKNTSLRDHFGPGIGIYSGGITEGIKNYFKQEFGYEFERDQT